jgi:hypothetical protein
MTMDNCLHGVERANCAFCAGPRRYQGGGSARPVVRNHITQRGFGSAGDAPKDLTIKKRTKKP